MTVKRREIPFARPFIGEAEKEAVAQVLSGHVLTHGPRCQEFEERFAELIGVKHAVTTSSCTAALHLSLMALEVGPGDEVVVPAQTHVATAHAVEHVGAKPVFVDVSRETGNLDVNTLAPAITSKTRAVFVVHYLGLPCDMDDIRSVTDGEGIAVVEDCALALGAHNSGKKAGALAAAGCFSFYPAKHITTTEGGMLTTDDDTMAHLVRKKRAFGYDKNFGERSQPGIYDVVMLGHNFRMSEVNAAIGLGQLNRLDGFLEARRRNAEILTTRLADIEEVSTFPLDHADARSSCYCVNAMLPEDGRLDRSALVMQLNKAGIGTSVHYPVAVPLTSYYRDKYGWRDEQFPVSHWISDAAISLPVGPHLNEDDMHYIADHFEEAVGKQRRQTIGN